MTLTIHNPVAHFSCAVCDGKGYTSRNKWRPWSKARCLACEGRGAVSSRDPDIIRAMVERLPSIAERMKG